MGLATYRVVQPSIKSLVEAAEQRWHRRETWGARTEAGLEGPPTIAELAKGFEPELGDALGFLGELGRSSRTEEPRRTRLLRLERHFQELWLLHGAEGALDGLAQARRTVAVPFGTQRRTLDEAWAQIALTPAAAEREALAQAWAREEGALLGELRRAFERAFQAAQARGASTLAQAWPALETHDAKARGEAAQAFLSATADGYRDVLGFALRRLDPTLKSPGASWADVRRALALPWTAEALRPEDAFDAVTRCWNDFGLPPNAQGRLLVDERRQAPPATTAASGHVFAPAPPDEVRLVLWPAVGVTGWASWLGAWGEGQLLANVGGALPFVERALGDAAHRAGVHRLTAGWAHDALWLKRFGRLPAAGVKDVARVGALAHLADARLAAALLWVELEAAQRGLTDAVLDEGVSRASQALGAAVPLALVLRGVGVLPRQRARVDAIAVEAALHERFEQRFNEDYWRNPAAGRDFLALAQGGLRATAEELLKDALGPSATLAACTAKAAGRLVAILNA